MFHVEQIIELYHNIYQNIPLMFVEMSVQRNIFMALFAIHTIATSSYYANAKNKVIQKRHKEKITVGIKSGENITTKANAKPLMHSPFINGINQQLFIRKTINTMTGWQFLFLLRVEMRFLETK